MWSLKFRRPGYQHKLLPHVDEIEPPSKCCEFGSQNRPKKANITINNNACGILALLEMMSMFPTKTVLVRFLIAVSLQLAFDAQFISTRKAIFPAHERSPCGCLFFSMSDFSIRVLVRNRWATWHNTILLKLPESTNLGVTLQVRGMVPITRLYRGSHTVRI
jgi:hypothetical protein